MRPFEITLLPWLTRQLGVQIGPLGVLAAYETKMLRVDDDVKVELLLVEQTTEKQGRTTV